ncbi:MAG: PASTA domain-containing protein [Ruminiclostridium sp.]|nr:PASTA domain-containing protein [Ruminiclostridium sp.]
MENNLKLCMGCMCRKEYSGPCEMCGYMDNTAYLPSYLPPKTVLMNRYIVGKLLAYNGEGAVYIGYDTELNKAVEIKEYMPDLLCTRKKGENTITVNSDSLPLYKSYLSEFADLYKTLMNNDETESVQKIYGIFSENNTGYVIMERLGGIPLSEYLKNFGGVMNWESVREIFPPLFTALNILHSCGIVHRGLSPESIFIDERGRLKLTAFGISASRTADSSLNQELFPGYAAPEQYSLSERQGGWTDIYGICAVLYRVLTGTEPQPADERIRDDMLAEPFLVNRSIPQNVSRTIVNGLSLDQNNRIHNVNMLVGKLFEQPKANDEPDGPVRPLVAPENIPPLAEKKPVQKKPVQKSRKKKKEKSNIGTIVGISVFLAIVTGFIIAIAYFSKQPATIPPPQQTTTSATTTPPVTTAPITTAPTSASETTTTADNAEKILLPDFVNRFYNTLESRYSMLVFNPTYEYNDTYAEGIVFDQDIEAGTEVTGGTIVNLKVSKGPESVALPDYVGMKVEEYTSKLSELGIKYDTESEETSEVKGGYVVRCSKEIGDKVLIAEDESVIVYYAVAPKKTETTPEEPEEPEEAETEEAEPEEPEETEPEEE